MPQEAVKTLVPEEAYTDRQEFIEYFYNYALQAITRRAMSTVLLGQRRMGKTEIFKRVVNRLFFEQDHTDPKAVVPVYYSFRDNTVDDLQFALEYVENFIRWYMAFRLRDPDLLSRKMTHEELMASIQQYLSLSPGLTIARDLLRVLFEDGVTYPSNEAIMLPRTVSDRDDSTIVMFLDEFQNTRLPHYEFDIVGFFHESVESPTCPHVVTGSAMTILSKEILGRGALFGRFDSEPIEPMTAYWGAELARRAAAYYHAKAAELVLPVISNRCGGNPFYNTAVIRQAAKQHTALDSEEAVNHILAVDLSSGFIWAELNDQVMRWIERINEYGITKWILYLSALQEDERIEPERIRQQIKEKDGRDVSFDTIQDVMIRLSRGDLLEYMELGGWFRKVVHDPILLDFLKAWGKFEVEGLQKQQIIMDTVKQYDILKRQIHDQKGYLAEIYLTQILWNAQRKTFAGEYFHCEHEVTFSNRFYYMTQRRRLSASEHSEVDVFAFGDKTYWICESKWWKMRKVGVKHVREFLELAEQVKASEGHKYFPPEGPFAMQFWLFARNGVTPDAERLLRDHQIYLVYPRRFRRPDRPYRPA